MKIKHLLAVVLVMTAFGSQAREYRRAGNSVSFRNARIEVLSPTMFSVREGTDFRFAPVVIDLGVTELPTAPVAFEVAKEAITIVYDPSTPVVSGGVRVEGEVAIAALSAPDTQNLGGVIGALDNCDGDLSHSEQNDISSSAYPRLTPNDGILSRRGYTVLKHTPDALNQYRDGDSYAELYVLCYGKEYRSAFRDFFSIAGAVPMFPKWSLGLIYSRWKDYTDRDYKQIVADFTF